MSTAERGIKIKERWTMCEQIAERLQAQGVNVDKNFIYNHWTYFHGLKWHEYYWTDVLKNVDNYASTFIQQFQAFKGNPIEYYKMCQQSEKQQPESSPDEIQVAVKRRYTKKKKEYPTTDAEKLKLVFWLIDKIGNAEETRRIVACACDALKAMNGEKQ